MCRLLLSICTLDFLRLLHILLHIQREWYVCEHTCYKMYLVENNQKICEIEYIINAHM